MDPLNVLRDFNTSGKLQQVELSGHHVQFGDRYKFAAATPVYKASAAAGGANASYTLQDILFYIKNRTLKPQEYVMAASQAGVSNINILDRKRLLDVLDGHTEVDPAMVPVVGDVEEPQAKRMRVEDETSTKSLREQERQLRNRNTMLLASTKDFRKVLEVIANVKKNIAKPSSHSAHHHSSSAQARPQSSSQSKAATDTRHASGTANALSSINQYGASGSRPPSSSQHAAQKPSSSSSQPRPGSGSGAPRASSSDQRPPPSSHKPAAPPPGKGAPAAPAVKKGGGVPIIIVPAGMTAMLNMYNAASFLSEGRYMPAQQAMASGAPKPSTATFQRTAHRAAPVEYQVTDKPPAANSPDWSRVVAVVVQGAKWQFKDWPHKGAKDGDLADAFNKVCGFLLHYADEKVGPPVSEWNVRRLPLQREARHKDVPVMMDLFKHLDTFLAAQRCSLQY